MIIAAPLAAQAIEQQRNAVQAELPPVPGRLVDLGGRGMHLLCSGAGDPTVVLEAGASSFAIDWTLVQREVSRSNRTCSYDRAGMGWSDPAVAANRATSADDLHALLALFGTERRFRLGVRRPTPYAQIIPFQQFPSLTGRCAALRPCLTMGAAVRE